MANTRFLPFPKLLYIIRVRVLVEPAGDKPFSFFFSVPGKDSIDRIEIRLQFLLRHEEEAAIGGRKSLSLPFGRLPTSFARFNATPSKRKASRSSFSSWRRRIVSGTQGVATLHPGETSLETTTGTPLQSRSSTPTTNMNSSLCESRTTSTTWRRTRAPDL